MIAATDYEIVVTTAPIQVGQNQVLDLRGKHVFAEHNGPIIQVVGARACVRGPARVGYGGSAHSVEAIVEVTDGFEARLADLELYGNGGDELGIQLASSLPGAAHYTSVSGVEIRNVGCGIWIGNDCNCAQLSQIRIHKWKDEGCAAIDCNAYGVQGHNIWINGGGYVSDDGRKCLYLGEKAQRTSWLNISAEPGPHVKGLVLADDDGCMHNQVIGQFNCSQGNTIPAQAGARGNVFIDRGNRMWLPWVPKT